MPTSDHSPAKSVDALKRAAGPLVVSAANPRYFEVRGAGPGERRAIYLAGSHIWNNLQDGMGPGAACPDRPEAFDYNGYLDFLEARGNNFIRLWRWEQFKSQAAGGSYHLCMTPQPWARTGPGTAKDGRPKFDLERFDPAFFERLRQRVSAAGERGIYVDVMLFDGWALHLSPAPDNVEGHPFHAANNINGVSLNSMNDYQVLPLDARVQAVQAAYIRKVVDTVQDLPNVLYEVANEAAGGGTVGADFTEALGLSEPPNWGDTTQWQYWVIDLVKRYEKEKGYDPHPIGITMQFPVADQTQVNDPLFNSQAEWISPGYDDEIFKDGGHPMAEGSPPTRWYADPPANDGRKIIINDTDHYAQHADALWAWKSFLRGHHPILMDYGLIDGVQPGEGESPFHAFEAARYAMGDTVRYARRMNLLEMTPRGDLCSTGYALANPGQEYLVLQPSEQASPITVNLEPGAYAIEWHNMATRETKAAGQYTVGVTEDACFTPGLAAPAPAVLYLKRV